MLTKVHNSIQATDFRKNLAKYLKASKKNPLVISVDRGGETRVIMNSALYNLLIEAYRDDVDAIELERLIAEDTGERIAWRDVKKNVVRN